MPVTTLTRQRQRQMTYGPRVQSLKKERKKKEDDDERREKRETSHFRRLPPPHSLLSTPLPSFFFFFFKNKMYKKKWEKKKKKKKTRDRMSTTLTRPFLDSLHTHRVLSLSLSLLRLVFLFQLGTFVVRPCGSCG